MKSTRGLKIAVLDTETDPFRRDRIPQPFTAGFYDGDVYLSEWGPHCVDNLLKRIAGLDTAYLIYCHNGGKFDFWSMLDWINETSGMTIINGRLVEFCMVGTKHVFRDSFAIFPISLSKYQKDDRFKASNYREFEANIRERHKPEISDYLKSDCVNLFAVVSKFAEQFTNDRGSIPISIGQAAIAEFRKVHDFDVMTEGSDAEIRQWYMGGRVQCFEAGVLKGPWKVYDVNSMYSHAMREYAHPVSDMYENLDRPPRGKRAIWFAEFEGSNRQAIPSFTEDGGIDFSLRQGRVYFDESGKPLNNGRPFFRACSHELVPAIAAGLVRVDKWLNVLKPSKTAKFVRYIDKWSGVKISAKLREDKAGELFAKFMNNTPYGKTGQNPRDFRDYKLCRDIFQDAKLRELGFEPEARLSDDPFLEMWSRKTSALSHGFFNVGIAASVTSAARAVLLDGMQRAVRLIYCDTDSLICKSFKGPVDPVKLGHWKHEATSDYAAIAGKKTYCLYNVEGRKIIPIKWASKGGDLDPLKIIRIAKGETIEFRSEVPTYSLSQGIHFISRKFKKTVENPEKFK